MGVTRVAAIQSEHIFQTPAFFHLAYKKYGVIPARYFVFLQQFRVKRCIDGIFRQKTVEFAPGPQPKRIEPSSISVYVHVNGWPMTHLHCRGQGVDHHSNRQEIKLFASELVARKHSPERAWRISFQKVLYLNVRQGRHVGCECETQMPATSVRCRFYRSKK